MKLTFAAAGACVVLLSATAPAQAQVPRASTTTQEYVAMCAKTTDVSAQNFCHGFGQGVYETYLITRHPKKAPPFICGKTPRALARITLTVSLSGLPPILNSIKCRLPTRFCVIWLKPCHVKKANTYLSL